MSSRKIAFPGASGVELAARLDVPPDDAPVAWVLFAHCFTCSKDLRAAVDISRGLSREGFGVLRFDFTGLGESEGDFADTDFSSNVADLVAAGRWMAGELRAPRVLVGHSLGGAAVLHAARELDSVDAVATIGAPSEPSHVLRLVRDRREEIEGKGRAEVTIAGRTFTVTRGFLEDLEAASLERAVAELGRALLLFHSPVDEVVGIENAAALYGWARHPKSFVSLDRARHLLPDPEDSGYVARVLAAWASRYVESRRPDASEEEVTAGDRVVATIGSDPYRTEIQARRHALVADEPASVGGGDLGPSPYDLVVAGLGACTAMTLRMYADRKGWPLEEVRVRLRHRKIHRKDEEECEEGRGTPRLDHVDRELEITGELDREQRERLVEIADRCPVHRTLEAGVRISTTVTRPGAGAREEEGGDARTGQG